MKLRGRDFSPIIHKFVDRLNVNWLAERVAQIKNDQREMRIAYLEGDGFPTVLDASDHKTTFDAGWKLIRQRFEALRDWAGEIAKLFPITAYVESDFFILG